MPGTVSYPMLSGPAHIAGLDLRNRVVMPPMASAMEVGSPQFESWYEARAEGGVGLIIMEALWIERLADPDYASRLTGAVERIHRHGIPVVLQLFQPSRDADGSPFAPSATPDARAATENELAAMPDTFAQAAARCQAAGFDGVEPHGAHGFFLNQMFSAQQNRRTDRYGGSLENRMRLGIEIASAIRSEVGESYPIFWRHTMQQAEGYSVDDSIDFLGALLQAGVNVLDISPSTTDRPPQSRHIAADGSVGPAEGCELADPIHCNLAALARNALGAPVIAVGGMEDPARAEAALASGKCDLCAVGRQLIADSDWPRKVFEGRESEIIACTKCDAMCFGNLRKGIPIGCTQNPRSGREYLQRC